MAQSAILNMFARSPIRPLQKHMAKVNACAAKLDPFFTAVLDDNWGTATSLQTEIVALENEADDLKLDLRMHLPRGLFLPVPRGDILSLLSKQDNIANCAKDVAGIVLGRHMSLPKTLADCFMTYIRRCIDATQQASKAINELDELLETGFRGKEVGLVERMIQKLNDIEHDTDKIQIELRRQLFAIENELSPIDVMFLYRIIETIGNIADMAEQAGGQLLILVAN